MSEFTLGMIFLSVVGLSVWLSSYSWRKKAGFRMPVETDFDGPAQEFFELYNRYRLQLGYYPVKAETLLTELALDHVEIMIENGKVTHSNFAQREYLAEAEMFGEVCSVNFITAQSKLAAFLRSEGHKKILETREFTHIGIADTGKFQSVILAKY